MFLNLISPYTTKGVYSEKVEVGGLFLKFTRNPSAINVE